MVYNAIIDNNHNDVIKYITNDNIDDCFLFAYRRRNFQMMHYILTLYKHRKLNPAKITLNEYIKSVFNFTSIYLSQVIWYCYLQATIYIYVRFVNLT